MLGLKSFLTSREDDKVGSFCDRFSSDVVCCLHKVAEKDIGADIMRYLDAELPLLDKGERADSTCATSRGLVHLHGNCCEIYDTTDWID